MNCIEKLLSLLMCIKNHKFSYICQLFLSKVKNKKLKSHNTLWYLTEQNGSSSNEFELGDIKVRRQKRLVMKLLWLTRRECKGLKKMDLFKNY